MERKDAGELLGLLGQIFTSNEEVYKPSLEEEVRNELRRSDARKLEKAYANTLKRVEGELEFSSVKYLMLGVCGLVSDAIYTLAGPIKQIVQSEGIKEMIEEKLGAGKTLLDLLNVEIDEKSTEKDEEDLKKAFDSIKRMDDYILAIAKHCEANEKTPKEVISSKEDMLGIIKEIYGSIEKYQESNQETIKSLENLSEKINMLKVVPFNVVVPILVSSYGKPDQLQKIGIDPAGLGNIVGSLANDVVKFGQSFLNEYADQIRNRAQQYTEPAPKKGLLRRIFGKA